MGWSDARWSVLLWIAALFAMGCVEDVGEDPADDDTVDDVGDDDDDDDDADERPCEPEFTGMVFDPNLDPIEPYVHGRILDARGKEPVAGIKVTCCLDVSCFISYTDADGRYWFDDLEDGLGYVFVVGHINTDGGAYTSLVAWFETPEASLEAPDIHLPKVDALLELGPGIAELDTGDDLHIEIDADVVDWAAREPCFGSVEIPQQTMTFVQAEGVEFLAAWGFHFWGNSAHEPVAVSFPVRGKLGCDQPVVVYAMDKHGDERSAYHNLIPVASGYHDCDAGRVVMDEGEGVSQFTWLAYGVEI